MEQVALIEAQDTQPMVRVGRDPHEHMMQLQLDGTVLVADAYGRASTPVQRALQRSYDMTAGAMLHALELLSCDIALHDAKRWACADLARRMRAAGVVVG